MGFCTVINCMDGRVQLPVNNFLQKHFGAEWVDTITEAGPNLILAQKRDSPNAQSLLDRLKISVQRHGSVGIAVVGHHDCAGNPSSREDQYKHIHESVEYLKSTYPDMEIIGLWVDDKWEVNQVAGSSDD